MIIWCDEWWQIIYYNQFNGHWSAEVLNNRALARAFITNSTKTGPIQRLSWKWRGEPGGSNCDDNLMHSWAQWYPGLSRCFQQCRNQDQQAEGLEEVSNNCWRALRSMVHQWLLQEGPLLQLPWPCYPQVLEDILKLTTQRKPKYRMMLPIALICLWWYWCSEWRCCVRHSVMKDVDNTESNDALAVVAESSDASNWTRQVVDKTCWQLSLNCDMWDVTLPGTFFDKDGDVFACLWKLASVSKWS